MTLANGLNPVTPLGPSESLLMKTLAQRFCPALTARWKIRGEKCPRNERKARDKKQNLKARHISSFRCWQSATKSEVNEAQKVEDTVISIFSIIINFIVIKDITVIIPVVLLILMVGSVNSLAATVSSVPCLSHWLPAICIALYYGIMYHLVDGNVHSSVLRKMLVAVAGRPLYINMYCHIVRTPWK